MIQLCNCINAAIAVDYCNARESINLTANSFDEPIKQAERFMIEHPQNPQRR